MTPIQPRASGRARIVTDPHNPKPSVTGSVSPATHAAFDKIATARGMSKGALVRELIEEFVKKEPQHERPRPRRRHY